MLALEALGIDLAVFSLTSPVGPTHAEARRLRAPVIYAPTPRRAALAMGAHLRGMALSGPGYARAATILAGRGRLRPVAGAWLRGVAMAPAARRLGVGHIHAHFATGANVAAKVMADLVGVPFSFTTHAVGIFARPTRLCATLRAGRFHVTISEYNRRALARRCGASAAAKVHVIRDAVDARAFAVAERRTGPRPRILSVGRLVEKKGHSVLLEALAILAAEDTNFEAVIVGDGPERGRLEALINRHGLAGRVELRGAATLDVVRGLHATSDIFALASIIAADGDRDGIPVSIMEAMAAGLPVVSTTVSGIPELVSDAVGRLVKPGDAPALAHALGALLADPGARRRLGDAAVAEVTAKCNVAEAGRRLAALFAGTG